jgi:hypothetical protein
MSSELFCCLDHVDRLFLAPSWPAGDCDLLLRQDVSAAGIAGNPGLAHMAYGFQIGVKVASIIASVNI